jgi:hypothetical protein
MSFRRIWQRCDTSGEDCRNISGATGRPVRVRTADVDHRLRALVTAITAAGVSTVASGPSAVVVGNTSTSTVHDDLDDSRETGRQLRASDSGHRLSTVVRRSIRHR